MFQQDLLLTEQQSNAMLNEINTNKVNGRKKRNAIFSEENPTQRWPVGQPIPYWFDQSLSKY